MNSFAKNDQKTRWHKCALSPNLAPEKCQLQGAISQLQIMIKTQFLHFSNVVFPEFFQIYCQIESTVNSFAKNDQKPDDTSVLYHQIWHQRKCQLQGAISQLQIMIKTQFLHFSNVVFPEFSKSIVKLSPQWIVLLKTTKNQMTQVCSITKSGTREVSTSRSHISASNYDKNTILALF